MFPTSISSPSVSFLDPKYSRFVLLSIASVALRSSRVIWAPGGGDRSSRLEFWKPNHLGKSKNQGQLWRHGSYVNCRSSRTFSRGGVCWFVCSTRFHIAFVMDPLNCIKVMKPIINDCYQIGCQLFAKRPQTSLGFFGIIIGLAFLSWTNSGQRTHGFFSSRKPVLCFTNSPRGFFFKSLWKPVMGPISGVQYIGTINARQVGSFFLVRLCCAFSDPNPNDQENGQSQDMRSCTRWAIPTSFGFDS